MVVLGGGLFLMSEVPLAQAFFAWASATADGHAEEVVAHSHFLSVNPKPLAAKWA